jgi:hypothetical protein
MSRRCATVIVSMYKMSAGKGYEYLLRTAVVEDGGNEDLSTALTRYACEAGPSRATPVSRPGRIPAGMVVDGR